MESPCGGARKWNVTSTGKQQTNLDTTPGCGDDGTDDSSVGQKVSVGDMDALPRTRKRLEIAPTQTPPSAEAGKVDMQGAVDWVPSFSTDRLAQVHTLRPSDLEREIGPARAPARIDVLVAAVDPTEERHLIVHQ